MKKGHGASNQINHTWIWVKLAERSLYRAQITPFVPENILIPTDLKLPMNQGLNKRPPTVLAVNLLSPFWALNRGS